MTMYAGDSVNEILNTTMDVLAVPSSLPGMSLTAQGTYPAGPRQGQPFTPNRAWINVETGALRLKCDGIDPDPGQGTLYTAGQIIDWSSPLGNFQGMIKRARLCREVSGTATRITISYRN